jgi:2-polyprenyl-3-methyl-5-hydroxy-6-metoxy-1,4-benzoquinol methylase
MPYSIKHCFAVMRRFVAGGDVLELGPAEGVMTELMVGAGYRMTLVEGSQKFCRDLSRRFPSARVVNSLFESYAPSVKFDAIVLGHVLEHVDDPVAIVKRAKDWLRPAGRMFAAVPNSRSIHRQAAVAMGLLARESALNDLDVHHGHQRVFDPESFRTVFTEAGLRIEAFGGYWLKPLSNRQLEMQWTPEMLSAFMALGERYPDIAAEIYVVAK